MLPSVPRYRKHPIDARYVLVIALLLGTVACEGKQSHISAEQAEKGMGMPDTSSDGKRIKLDPRCDLNETIVDPKEGTPDYVIAQLLEAAADGGDEKVAFQKFYSQFPPDTEERWVRDQYFSRARKYVNKYLQQDAGNGIMFKICERRPQGEGEFKIFIQSLDPNKSNPPITLKKDDAGAWKVIFYTP